MVAGLAGQRVAVTGAGGFIGTHVRSVFAAQGASLLLLGTAQDRGLPVRGGDSMWLPGVVAGDPDQLARALSTCSALVHLAWVRPPGGGTLRQLRSELEENVNATANLLRAAAAAGVSHVTFASTSQVYPVTGVNRETGPVQPQNPYAASKLMQEALVRAWAQETGNPSAVVRLATVYGPGEPARRAVPRWILAGLEGRPLQVDGDGSQTFSPVFAGDVAGTLGTVVARRADGIFNLAGEPATVLSVAGLVARLCGGRDIALGVSPGRQTACCDTSRAASLLAFRPTPLETGLAQEIAWLKGRTGQG